MVRFSYISTPSHCQRTKLGVTMLSNLQEKSDDIDIMIPSVSASTDSKVDDNNNLSNNSEEQTTSLSSHGDVWKSEYLNGEFCADNNKELLQVSGIKKSMSLGCILDKARHLSDEDEATDDEIKFSRKEDDLVEPFDLSSDQVHCRSLFSIEVLEEFDTRHHHDVDSGCLSSENPPLFAKSCSVTNLRLNADKSKETMGIPSKSFENLHSLNGEITTNSYHISEAYDDHRQKGSDSSGGLTEGQEISGTYLFGSDNKHTNQINLKLKHIENYDQLNPKVLSTRRIEDWISQIDIGDESIVEEPGKSSTSSFASQVEGNVPKVMPDAKSNMSMEAAYNYISSLPASSASAQMANLGLNAVPFLSGFSSLRVLNLSGNSIDRISSRSLPRGLHMLNLSKNNIAVIEGLRDLTRLRVLDLSYNRIARIGHGLASCSSLKELYLTGNKISEVEGLHRLLKLNILDLRGNRISTAKCLGQLAANYASLQAIYLEGNPAQRNVGDDQLKKYLMSLLPNLVYYNKHVTKSSGAKEISDRPSRSLIAHQYDRGSRTELKLPRRGSHGSGLHKSALKHGGSRSRNVETRQVRLLPSPMEIKPVENGKKVASLEASNTIQRSRSHGALGNLKS